MTHNTTDTRTERHRRAGEQTDRQIDRQTDRQTDRQDSRVADHTFLVCPSLGSRRRVFESLSKSSFVASAANAFYDSVFDRLFAHVSICTVCCLQVTVWYSLLCVFSPTFPSFECRHHGLHATLLRVTVGRLLWWPCTS